MSILEKMRTSTDSTFMQVVLGIICVAMFFWYSPTQGDQSRTVATVNGVQIRDTVYFPKYREAYARAQQRGMKAGDEDALATEVKTEMAREEVLRQIAVSRGLTASDGDIRTVIRNDFRFFNPETNEYDESIYKEYRQSRSVQELERGFETSALINKLRWSIVLGVDLPKDRVKKQYIDFATQADIQYVRVDPNVIRETIEVSEGDVSSWVALNDPKIQDRYDKDFKRFYDFPERLVLDIIRLDKSDDGPTEDQLLEQLKAVRTLAVDGTSMEQLARKWSEDESAINGGRLPERRLPTLTQAERDALASLKAGDISEVITTDRSIFFYRLESRTEAETISKEAAQSDIALNLIREERASEATDALAQQIMDAWKESGEARDAVIADNGLQIDQTGLVNQRNPKIGGPPEEMVLAALDSENDAVLSKVYVSEQGGRSVRFVGQVSEVKLADMEYYSQNEAGLYERSLIELRRSMWMMWVDEQVASADVVIQ